MDGARTEKVENSLSHLGEQILYLALQPLDFGVYLL